MAVVLIAAAPLPLSAHAAAGRAPQAQTAHQNITIEAGSGRVLGLSRPAANIFVADPKVVEVRPASTRSIFAFGLKEGHTTIAVLDAAGGTVALYDVTISTDSSSAKLVAHAVADRSTFLAGPPGEVSVGPEAGGVTLGGTVPDPAHAVDRKSVV